eukprot:8701087-Pyramimonas_sp.AAC.1
MHQIKPAPPQGGGQHISHPLATCTSSDGVSGLHPDEEEAACHHHCRESHAKKVQRCWRRFVLRS